MRWCEVVELVAAAGRLNPDAVANLRTKVAPIVEARQVALWLWCRVLEHSQSRTAREAGLADHTTVGYACKRVEAELVKGRGYRADLVDAVIEMALERVDVPRVAPPRKVLHDRSGFEPMGVGR